MEDDDVELVPTTLGYDLDIVPHQLKKKFLFQSQHYQNLHFELLQSLPLTVGAAQLEAIWTKRQKPATSPAHAHRWD